MPATNKGNAHTSARANITRAAHWSTLATILNNQAIGPSHNAIVILQTTQTAFHKQRKCDNANNTSVIMANCRVHNAIVISQSHRQAFVTKRNISSAYLSYRLSLYSTFVLYDSSGLALVRLHYSTPVLLCGYAHTTISAYAHMRIEAYNDSVMQFYDFITMKF